MAMRLFYGVDIHGRFDVADRAIRDAGAVDLVVIGGDITHAGSVRDVSSALDRWRAICGVELLAVAGNMDSIEIDEWLSDQELSFSGSGKIRSGVPMLRGGRPR